MFRSLDMSDCLSLCEKDMMKNEKEVDWYLLWVEVCVCVCLTLCCCEKAQKRIGITK